MVNLVESILGSGSIRATIYTSRPVDYSLFRQVTETIFNGLNLPENRQWEMEFVTCEKINELRVLHTSSGIDDEDERRIGKILKARPRYKPNEFNQEVWDRSLNVMASMKPNVLNLGKHSPWICLELYGKGVNDVGLYAQEIENAEADSLLTGIPVKRKYIFGINLPLKKYEFCLIKK